MADKVVFATSNDGWEGIYVNGELKVQGHRLEVTDAFRAAGLDFDRIEVDDEWLFKVRQLPDQFKDVRVQDNG